MHSSNHAINLLLTHSSLIIISYGVLNLVMYVSFRNYLISILPKRALPIVASSANSKSPPIGKPRAILDTFTKKNEDLI